MNFSFKQNVPWFDGNASNFRPWYQLLKTMADGTTISPHCFVIAELLQGAPANKLPSLNQNFQHLELRSSSFASYEQRGYDVPVVTHLIGRNLSFYLLAGLRPIKKC